MLDTLSDTESSTMWGMFKLIKSLDSCSGKDGRSYSHWMQPNMNVLRWLCWQPKNLPAMIEFSPAAVQRLFFWDSNQEVWPSHSNGWPRFTLPVPAWSLLPGQRYQDRMCQCRSVCICHEFFPGIPTWAMLQDRGIAYPWSTENSLAFADEYQWQTFGLPTAFQQFPGQKKSIIQCCPLLLGTISGTKSCTISVAM